LEEIVPQQKKWIAALIGAVAFASTAMAQDAATPLPVTPDSATALQKSILGMLPDRLTNTGFLSVKALEDAYDIQLDWGDLLPLIKDPAIKINGLTPMSIITKPLSDGLWQVDSSGHFNVTGERDLGVGNALIIYSIDHMQFSGIYDPSIFYMKSATGTASNITFSSGSPKENINASMATMNQTMESVKNPDGSADISSASLLTDFKETVANTKTGAFELNAKTVSTDISVSAVRMREIYALISFIMAHSEKNKLTPDENKALKDLIKAGLPLWGQFSETISANDVAITTEMGNGTLGKLGVGIHMDGISNDAEMGMSMIMEKPGFPAGILPDAYLAAVPTKAELDVSIPGLNVADGVNMLIDTVDYANPKPITPEQDAKLGEALVGQTMDVSFNKLSLLGDFYDLELNGKMTVNMKVEDKQSTAISLYARDLDKTIAYLQKNAAAVPEYGQAAFVALMLKGFAVTEPDGRQKWLIEMDENKNIKINGNVFNVPK
jgi:hypothetical protein